MQKQQQQQQKISELEPIQSKTQTKRHRKKLTEHQWAMEQVHLAYIHVIRALEKMDCRKKYLNK